MIRPATTTSAILIAANTMQDFDSDTPEYLSSRMTNSVVKDPAVFQQSLLESAEGRQYEQKD